MTLSNRQPPEDSPADQNTRIALEGTALTERLRRLVGWEVVNRHYLRKEYRFPDFVTALAFVNRIAELAEAEQHHPDLALSWGKVGVQLFTHSVDGLTEADFRLAARIDELPH